MLPVLNVFLTPQQAKWQTCCRLRCAGHGIRTWSTRWHCKAYPTTLKWPMSAMLCQSQRTSPGFQISSHLQFLSSQYLGTCLVYIFHPGLCESRCRHSNIEAASTRHTRHFMLCHYHAHCAPVIWPLRLLLTVMSGATTLPTDWGCWIQICSIAAWRMSEMMCPTFKNFFPALKKLAERIDYHW